MWFSNYTIIQLILIQIKETSFQDRSGVIRLVHTFYLLHVVWWDWWTILSNVWLSSAWRTFYLCDSKSSILYGNFKTYERNEQPMCKSYKFLWVPKILQIYYALGDLLHGCSLTTLLFSSNNLQFTMADTSEGSTPGTDTFWVRIQKMIQIS